MMTIKIDNFRSVKEAIIELTPLTVLYGPTSSGKSSLLYALQVLRNFTLNPNRPADAFFNLGFIDLGGFDACVLSHARDAKIGIWIENTNEKHHYLYGTLFDKQTCEIRQEADGFIMEASVGLPYGFNQTHPYSHTEGDVEYNITWNGITSNCTPKNATAETQKRSQEIARELNAPSEVIKSIDIIPSKRGFFKPVYAASGISPVPISEDEVASIIINDQHLPAKISTYMEEIFKRDFRIQPAPGTAAYNFLSTDKSKKARMPVQLVNEGFGINQVVYMLAKLLRVDNSIVLIEEPEVHLHPHVIQGFVEALVTIISDEDKQVVCTTHSEQFIVSLLAAVAEGLIKPENLRFYLTEKEGKYTAFKKQEVHANGQIDGGLISFMEAETEVLEKFLGARKKNG